MRAIRRTAAKKLLKHQLHNNELSEILDFFSNIAYMVELGALDASMAYKPFEYWILRYWYNAQEHVTDQRRFDADSWKTLEKLIRDFERSKKGTRDYKSNDSLRHFLIEEAQIEETAESVAPTEQKIVAGKTEKHER